MRVLLHGPRPTRKGGGEKYLLELERGLRAHADVSTWLAGDPAPTGRFDVFHATSFMPASGRAARRLARASVATFHISPLQNARHGWRTGRGGVYRLGQLAHYARELAQTALYLRRLDRAIAVSPSTAEGLTTNWPAARAKVRVVENGVDVSRFRPGGRDGGYGLFVGRLERVKGPHLALEAFRRLGLPLKLAGSGSMEAELRTQTEGMDAEFVPAPSDDELVRLYQEARVAVFPSANEGYPFVVLEALACGTPVVSARAFACGPPVDALVRWVPVGDAAALADAVRATWDAKTPEYARATHDAVAASHAWDAVVARTVDVYREALAER